MKWVLVVMVMGSAPVKTDLVFSSLSECLEAEMTMRSEYAAAYNRWIAWAQKNQKGEWLSRQRQDDAGKTGTA